MLILTGHLSWMNKIYIEILEIFYLTFHKLSDFSEDFLLYIISWLNLSVFDVVWWAIWVSVRLFARSCWIFISLADWSYSDSSLDPINVALTSHTTGIVSVLKQLGLFHYISIRWIPHRCLILHYAHLPVWCNLFHLYTYAFSVCFWQLIFLHNLLPCALLLSL